MTSPVATTTAPATVDAHGSNGARPPLSDPSWPILANEALHGVAGDIVRAVDPYTEADPVAVLSHALVAFGNLVGPGPYMAVGSDRHPLRLNMALAAQSSKGRKGTAWGVPRELLGRVDPEWKAGRIKTGLSSGEGLIYHLRDPRQERHPIKDKGRTTDYEWVEVDPGEPDKRLLVIKPELAVLLRRMGADGNSLSGVIREAWDSGDLATLTKNSPLRASGAHVSVIGHITEEELAATSRRQSAPTASPIASCGCS
jgi:hypothetical protein